MSCDSDQIRQQQWADELWNLIQTSPSMEVFATRLLAYAEKLNQEVNGKALEENPLKVNGQHPFVGEAVPSAREVPTHEA